MKRNAWASKCRACGVMVAVGGGLLTRTATGWQTHHAGCLTGQAWSLRLTRSVNLDRVTGPDAVERECLAVAAEGERKVPVGSFAEAARLFRQWLQTNGYGAGDLAGAGEICSGRDTVGWCLLDGRCRTTVLDRRSMPVELYFTPPERAA